MIKIVFGLTGKPVAYPDALRGDDRGNPDLLQLPHLHHLLHLAILISLWLFLKKSDLGMIIRAATRDSLMVQVLGMNTSRIWTIGFASGSGLPGWRVLLPFP